MKFNMDKYPISFWNTINMKAAKSDMVETWRDLGITLAMSPSYEPDDYGKVTEMLDRAEKLGIKVILCDYRTHWRRLTKNGVTAYTSDFKQAVSEYGNHPAVFGFFVGDEPDAPDAADAFLAVKIQQEEAPHLIAYINLLPWFDWIGERMGTDTLANYLDRVANEGTAKLLSYDCYAQMWDGERGYHDYFNNLREYYEAVKRLNLPFFNIVLSCGHYAYRCPSKDDMQWQLGTSVAHGASGVSWFFTELPGIWDNYRNAPINQLGERTEQFGWISEVNRVFNNYCGETIHKNNLVIDTCYHVTKAYGGLPLFEPFGNVLNVKSEQPAVFSRFHDDNGGVYYITCVNSPFNTASITMTFKADVNIERCAYGNTFAKIHAHTDPIGKMEGEGGQTINI
ncbi:MAG: hypothetical protein FWF15_09770, partial [Oscillospiraceae bacterium]|nr:hypothetical protein [Oscillospiraceae bacterium]